MSEEEGRMLLTSNFHILVIRMVWEDEDEDELWSIYSSAQLKHFSHFYFPRARDNNGAFSN